MKPRICLNMIVKNESHVILECLQSILHLVDYYVINDTGSTDDTKEKIKAFFDNHNIKGEIYDHEFRTCKCHGDEYKKYKYFHFGWNRTYALQKCIGKSDYIFIMDADDVVEGNLKFPSKLTADQYYIKLRTDFNNYYRPLLIKNDKKYNWEFKDGLHEFLTSNYPNILTYTLMGDYAINSRRISDRNKNDKRALDDVDFLKILMKERPDYTRYKHYYAQSLYDAKLYEDAIKAYKEYIPFETFEEAKYLARIMIARAHLRIDNTEKNKDNILKAFCECFKYHPEYAEPMYELSKYFNGINKYEDAYLYGSKAVNIKMPINKLLAIDTEVYTFKLLDEMIWCCVETKRYDEALRYCNKLITSDKLNQEQKDIAQTNIIAINNLKQQYDLNNTEIIKHVIDKFSNKPIIGFYLGPSPLKQYYGSEIAAFNLSAEFVKLGYNILFFADEITKINLADSKNIVYLPSSVLKTWNYAKLKVMIVSRYVNYFIENDVKTIAEKTYIWLHDINFHPYYMGTHLPCNGNAIVKNTIDIVDGYICATQWHKNNLIQTYKLPDNKIHVIGLGIDIDKCSKIQSKKVKNRFIWVSDYQRGLEEFVKKFGILKAYIIDAELHIYRDLPDDLKEKYKYLDYIKLKGHCSNDDILKAMGEAEYFCLISDFKETFCLSALEAQAMGCICITTDLAALAETVADRGLIVDKHNLLDKIAEIFRDSDIKNNIIKKAKDWAFKQSWNNKAKMWLELFNISSDKMFKRLSALKQFGFNPKYVIDIGANVGDWSRNVLKIYPETHIKAFEANPQCKEHLKDLDHEIILLGDREDDFVPFYVIPGTKCTTGASMLKENTSYYDAAEVMYLSMKTLDSFCKDIDKIDLLKLDVQGSELIVLDGANDVLKKTEFVLLEVSIMKYNDKAPLIAEVIAYMKDKGFNLFDIVENHYLGNLCIQTDILFLNVKSHLTRKIAKSNHILKIDNIYD